MKPGKHQRSKQRCQDLYSKVHDRGVDNLLLCVHTICINHVTETLLLVTSSVSNCLLWTVKTKNENKNIKQITLSSLKTIHLYWLCSKHSLGWKICLFGNVLFFSIESSRTSDCRTVFMLLLLTMFSESHIYAWQLTRLHCFSLSHAQGMFNLGRICKNSETKIGKPA